MTDYPETDAPEAINRSQKDKSEQAQSQSRDARADNIPQPPATDHDDSGNANRIIPPDKQDVVDHMKQMTRSGQIDTSAYAGERNDDDEESSLGILDAAEDDSPFSEKGGADTGNSG